MHVSLLAHTHNPELLICKAAHVCYSDKHISDINTDDAPRMIAKLIDSGHLSPLEHASFSFAIDGISRVCLAQLTRHRIASFSVRSHRYTSVGNNDFVDFGGRSVSNIEKMIASYNADVYSGVPKEDARYALPQAVTTSLVLSMNARELLHFFALRCCLKAQWEIRELAYLMLELVKTVAPNVFKKAGAKCQQIGFCSEAQPCGKKDVPHKHFLFSLYKFWLENKD